MVKEYRKLVYKFDELGSDLDLTERFQKFRAEQPDLVLFLNALFEQKNLSKDQIYYLVFNGYIIDTLLGDGDSKLIPIVLLNEKLDELYTRYYRGADFFSVDAKHSMNEELMNVLIYEFRDFVKDSSLNSETCLLAVSALESIIDCIYELRS